MQCFVRKILERIPSYMLTSYTCTVLSIVFRMGQSTSHLESQIILVYDKDYAFPADYQLIKLFETHLQSPGHNHT